LPTSSARRAASPACGAAPASATTPPTRLRLLQGLIRSFVEREAAAAVEQYLANVKRALEAS